MDPTAILEQAPLPILVVQDGRIVYVNPILVWILRRYGYDHDAETILGTELMDLVHPSDRAASRENIQRLLRSEARVAWNTPRLLQDAAGNPYVALISTSRIEWEGRPALVASFVLMETDQRLRDGDGKPLVDEQIDARLRALEGLTPRERQVALLIAGGYSTDNIRARLGVRDSTLRSHIKAIYRKTATHSRTELTRYLFGFR